uniref:Dynein light chain n=1 Tax=Heterorhabditis bacteriophora TaxID=37862 RepID=A0A1I7WRC3_HETBA
MEIENYNDFEKAADALEHAQRSVSRGLEGGTNVIILQEMQEKIRRFQNQIKKFDKIKSNYASDPADAVRQLQNFAEEATEADIIRPSHIFALLIAHHAGKQNWSPVSDEAYRCILQLQKQQPKLDLTIVVDAEILNRVYTFISFSYSLVSYM